MALDEIPGIDPSAESLMPDVDGPWEGAAPEAPSPEFEFDVAIIGLGYVGLPTALAFRATGAKVLGVDASADRLISIGAELVDLSDADHERLSSALTDDGFQLTSNASMISGARAVIVCVPTPVDKYFTHDLTALRAACATVVKHATPGQLLVLTSTTYVGCTQNLLAEPVRRRGLRVGEDVGVAFIAQRIDRGGASGRPDTVRCVVGGATPACEQRAADAVGRYADSVVRVPSLATAEMTKLLEYTFRPDKALTYELADIC